MRRLIATIVSAARQSAATTSPRSDGRSRADVADRDVAVRCCGPARRCRARRAPRRPRAARRGTAAGRGRAPGRSAPSASTGATRGVAVGVEHRRGRRVVASSTVQTSDAGGRPRRPGHRRRPPDRPAPTAPSAPPTSSRRRGPSAATTATRCPSGLDAADCTATSPLPIGPGSAVSSCPPVELVHPAAVDDQGGHRRRSGFGDQRRDVVAGQVGAVRQQRRAVDEQPDPARR